jgi:hypothetical protein
MTVWGLRALPFTRCEEMTIASTPSRRTFWRQANFNPPDLD